MPSVMRISWLVSLTVFLPVLSHAGCIPAGQAGKHVGETKCIAGKVVQIEKSVDGALYLDFCENAEGCPFTAVIFPEDLKHVGDVRQLRGKSIEVHGEVTERDGQAEIVVSEPRQLKGEVANIPPMPKNYDVEEAGHYSPGIFSHPKAARATSKKRQPATLPIDIPEDAEQ
jgi:hypothetical protein